MSACPRCKTNVPNAHIRCPACGQNPEDRSAVIGGYDGAGVFDDIDGQFEQRDTNFELDVRAGPKRILAADQQQQRMPDPYEIAVLADFGPAPASLWEFPAYAWRVTRRRRALRGALARVRAGVASAESVRDDLLARLGEAARPAIEKNAEMAVLLQSLSEVEATSHEREQSLAGRSQEFARKVGEIDQNVAAQEEEGTRLRDGLAAAQAGYDRKEEIFRRAQAAYKRAEIEFRNAQNASQGLDAGVAADAQARMPALLQVVDRRRAELRGPESELDKARAVLELSCGGPSPNSTRRARCLPSTSTPCRWSLAGSARCATSAASSNGATHEKLGCAVRGSSAPRRIDAPLSSRSGRVWSRLEGKRWSPRRARPSSESNRMSRRASWTPSELCGRSSRPTRTL
ncbi:MAG: hypothetical protein MUF54_05345 [Polyangiaceae bacterium]|nr:hypothetical protein [Polyangiaceae bacterium]